MGLHIAFNRQTASIKMKAVLVLSLICTFQLSSASASIAGERFQEPECETMGGTCEGVNECIKGAPGNMVIAGKCVRQQFDKDAKYCCVKATGDGSGVISADEGIVGTPDEYDY